MVGVAQLAEHRVVVPRVAGSSPVTHPIPSTGRERFLTRRFGSADTADMDRRAKIVCTLGPASQSPEAILALVNAGMDVARLNLSHGDHSVHAEVYRHVRAASDQTGRSVGILVDLQGPKIRLGHFANGFAMLVNGSTFTLTTEEVEGDAAMVSTTYEPLARDVKAGDSLLIDDGNVRLVVERTNISGLEPMIVSLPRRKKNIYGEGLIERRAR